VLSVSRTVLVMGRTVLVMRAPVRPAMLAVMVHAVFPVGPQRVPVPCTLPVLRQLLCLAVQLARMPLVLKRRPMPGLVMLRFRVLERLQRPQMPQPL
jgi:hypothetical protein